MFPSDHRSLPPAPPPANPIADLLYEFPLPEDRGPQPVPPHTPFLEAIGARFIECLETVDHLRQEESYSGADEGQCVSIMLQSDSDIAPLWRLLLEVRELLIMAHDYRDALARDPEHPMPLVDEVALGYPTGFAILLRYFPHLRQHVSSSIRLPEPE